MSNALRGLRDLAVELNQGDAKSDPNRSVILVVDDDPHVRSALESLFSSNYTVNLAASGQEALALVCASTAVVILDIRMQGLDGFQTLQMIRERDPHVPIIFHSAHQDIKDPLVVLNDYRPFGYILKGNAVRQLQVKVDAAVQHWRQLQENVSPINGAIRDVLRQIQRVADAQRIHFLERSQGPLTLGHFDRPEARISENLRNLANTALKSLTTQVQIEDNTPGPKISRVGIPVTLRKHITGVVILDGVKAAPESTDACPWLPELAPLVTQLGVLYHSKSLSLEGLRGRLRERTLRNKHLTARLKALQARVNPHFLYNTLTGLLALISEDPARAQTLVLELSRVFRHVLEGSRKAKTSLARELHIIEDYLNIETLRMGSRLTFSVSTDSSLDPETLLVPSLLLLPLVENAVLHGASSRPKGGNVQIQVSAPNATILRILVKDNGPGLGGSAHRGTGTSWRDLKRRLQLIYDGTAVIRRKSSKAGLLVLIEIPITRARSPATMQSRTPLGLN